MRCKGGPRKSWLAQVEPKERIGSPRQSLGYITDQKPLDKRESEEFEMVLQHKSKL